ncbi:MAG: formamidopyrimidine-DNA glycosylase [Ilumatobacter sp.]|jgi:formamidopyrimidine-DNA glycosylase
MPEGLEAEIWRRSLEGLVGSTITHVWVDQRSADPGMPAMLPGSVIGRIDRLGKVVLIVTDGPTIGLHFGMTGRVEVHGAAPIEQLEYASGRDLAEWDRLRVWVDAASTSDTPALRLNDPRRLGKVSIDPDLTHLGVDFFAIDRATMQKATANRRSSIKSLLLDQSAIAGLGNLCADEVLWWSGIAPQRPANSLTHFERAALVTAIRRRMPIMLRRGGSTTGMLSPEVRSAAGPCERDGAALKRSKVGGRTAVWCPVHQH